MATWKRRAGIGGLVVLGLMAGLTLFVVIDGWFAFGKMPAGERLERIETSAQWKEGQFENPLPMWNDYWGMLTSMFDMSEYAEPHSPIPVINDDGSRFSAAPPSGLRVTWLGHSEPSSKKCARFL